MQRNSEDTMAGSPLPLRVRGDGVMIIIRPHVLLKNLQSEGLDLSTSTLVLITDWSFDEADAIGAAGGSYRE